MSSEARLHGEVVRLRGKDAVSPAPDPHPRGSTRFLVPPGAADCHAHVVGAGFVEERSYTPPSASAGEYLDVLAAEGMTHGVLVQVSSHGTDNSYLAEVLEDGRGLLRGVALVAPGVSDRVLGRLNDVGVVGVRLNTLGGGGIGIDRLDDYEQMCAELGWHIELIASPASLRANAVRLGKLRVPYVVDHMAHVDVSAGTADPDWRVVLDLVADGAWIKLTGAYRLSSSPSYDDTIPYARQLVATAPDRVVWGSDWPHVGFWGPMPNVGDLLDLLADWVPDKAQRDTILVANPRRLYGFARR